MKKSPVKPTINELKDEFVRQTQLLTARIDEGSPVEELHEIRNRILAIIDQLHIRAQELINSDDNNSEYP